MLNLDITKLRGPAFGVPSDRLSALKVLAIFKKHR